jgi:hypothetical protein
MIEYSLLLFLIFKSFIKFKKKTIHNINNNNNNNNEKKIIIDKINSNDYIDNDIILDNIKKLLSFYNYEGHILLSRVKNDLIRDKKNKLNKIMVEKIKKLNNNILIKQEIKKINRDMIIYNSNIEFIFKKLRNDILSSSDGSNSCIFSCK